MFKIPKFSIYIVFEVAKTSGTWEYSHVELCTNARLKQGFRCWTQHEFTLFWNTNIWIYPSSLLMWYLSLKQSHRNYFHLFPVRMKSAMTNCNRGILYEEWFSVHILKLWSLSTPNHRNSPMFQANWETYEFSHVVQIAIQCFNLAMPLGSKDIQPSLRERHIGMFPWFTYWWFLFRKDDSLSNLWNIGIFPCYVKHKSSISIWNCSSVQTTIFLYSWTET